GPELLRALLVDQPVAVAVTRHLVPGGSDAPDHLGVALRVPGEHEKRALDPGLVEQGEHAIGVAGEARLVPAPLRPRHDRIEVRHLVPVLHVDGEAVDRRGGGGHRATATIARRRETSDAAAARPRVETPWRPARRAPGQAPAQLPRWAARGRS